LKKKKEEGREKKRGVERRGRGALDKKSHHGHCTSRTMPSFIDCSVRRHRTLCAVNVRRIAEHERETEKTYGERTEWRTRYERSRQKRNKPDKKKTTEGGGRGWRKKYEESTRLRSPCSILSSFSFFSFLPFLAFLPFSLFSSCLLLRQMRIVPPLHP